MKPDAFGNVNCTKLDSVTKTSCLTDVKYITAIRPSNYTLFSYCVWTKLALRKYLYSLNLLWRCKEFIYKNDKNNLIIYFS